MAAARRDEPRHRGVADVRGAARARRTGHRAGARPRRYRAVRPVHRRHLCVPGRGARRDARDDRRARRVGPRALQPRADAALRRSRRGVARAARAHACEGQGSGQVRARNVRLLRAGAQRLSRPRRRRARTLPHHRFDPPGGRSACRASRHRRRAVTRDGEGVPDGLAQSPLPWQHDVVASLLSRRSQWPHALLVTGPAGIGKRMLAQAIARALLCEAPRAGGAACGECTSCRYVAAAQHPDLRTIEPIEIDDDGDARIVEWIAVERIRALTRWAAITSHRGGAKVALIVPAERMSEAAANALLKTLEEPPDGTCFLLVSNLPGRLPATIASRCQRIVAPRPTPAQARAWLMQHGTHDPDALLAQAHGAPLRALALADPAYQGERSAWIRAFAAP